MSQLRKNARCSFSLRDHLAPNNRGFTLIEVIASLVLLSLLAAVFGMGLVGAVQSHEFSRANVELAQKAQPAMTRMTRELMELTHIENQTATSILYQRMPPPGTTTAVDRYGLIFSSTAGTLRLYSSFGGIWPLDPNQGDLLVDGVKNFALTYRSGSIAWDAADIRDLSTIEIVLDLLHPGQNKDFRQFRTIVHLRNTRNFGGAAPTTSPASRDDYSCFVHTTFSQNR